MLSGPSRPRLSKSNNAAFLDLSPARRWANSSKSPCSDLEKRQVAIDALVKPVKDSLDKVDEKIHALERAREQAYGEMRQQFTQMGEVQALLRQETSNLVKALRQPHVRGRWGEIQLRRVVEISGMMKHCDSQGRAGIRGYGRSGAFCVPMSSSGCRAGGRS